MSADQVTELRDIVSGMLDELVIAMIVQIMIGVQLFTLLRVLPPETDLTIVVGTMCALPIILTYYVASPAISFGIRNWHSRIGKATLTVSVVPILTLVSLWVVVVL